MVGRNRQLWRAAHHVNDNRSGLMLLTTSSSGRRERLWSSIDALLHDNPCHECDVFIEPHTRVQIPAPRPKFETILAARLVPSARSQLAAWRGIAGSGTKPGIALRTPTAECHCLTTTVHVCPPSVVFRSSEGTPVSGAMRTAKPISLLTK